MYNTIGSHWKGATNNVCMVSGVAFSLEYSIKRSIKFDESSLSRFALAGGLTYERKSKGSVLGSANSSFRAVFKFMFVLRALVCQYVPDIFVLRIKEERFSIDLVNFFERASSARLRRTRPSES